MSPASQRADVVVVGGAAVGSAVAYFLARDPDFWGSVMVIEFELDGQPFTGLNGGPMFKFTEAISLVVHCDTQDEIDHYWNTLGAGGDPRAQQCGWLKDRYGLSWQIVPSVVGQLMTGPNSDRVMAAVMQMKKLDLAAMQAAAR